MTYSEFLKKIESLEFFKLIAAEKKHQILDGVKNLAASDLDLIYEDFEIQEKAYQKEKQYHLDMAQEKADEVNVLVYAAESKKRKNELAESQKNGLSEDAHVLADLDSLLHQ